MQFNADSLKVTKAIVTEIKIYYFYCWFYPQSDATLGTGWEMIYIVIFFFTYCTLSRIIWNSLPLWVLKSKKSIYVTSEPFDDLFRKHYTIVYIQLSVWCKNDLEKKSNEHWIIYYIMKVLILLN
jgi:hypothetical protein